MLPQTKTVPPFFESGAPPPTLPLLTYHTELLLNGLHHVPPLYTQELPVQPQSIHPIANSHIAITSVTLHTFPLLPDISFGSESATPTQNFLPPTPHSSSHQPRSPTPRLQRREVTFSIANDTTSDSSSKTDSPTPPSPRIIPADLDDGKIQKPEGEVGRPGRGGYNLQHVLQWQPQQFSQLQICPP